MARDYLKLHFIIILWGFTAVLGDLIVMSAGEIVFWRCGLASIVLALILGKRVSADPRDVLLFFANGLIIGLHWITFFLAVKVANVSICMIGVATLSLWTAILEPLFTRNRKYRPIDLIFGIIIIIGVAVIFRNELRYSDGFFIAIFSAFAAALFSIFNSFFVKRAHHQTITFYEMIGATTFAFLSIPFLVGHEKINLSPSAMDWLYLSILVLVCTVYAFSHYVELLKRLTVFSINFANNLEPVYGILLAALILKDYQYLNLGYYFGASIILVAIAIYPILRAHIKRREIRLKQRKLTAPSS